jgi:hypothetical protein
MDDETDTKGVRAITLSPDCEDMILRSFVQLHITIEKTVLYDVDDDRGSGMGSGPSSHPNSPAIFPLKPTNLQV